MEDHELQSIRQRLNRMDCKLDQMTVRVNEELVTKDELKQAIRKPRKEESFLTWWANTGLAWTIAFVVMVMMILGLISLMNYKGNEGYYDREIRTDRQ